MSEAENTAIDLTKTPAQDAAPEPANPPEPADTAPVILAFSARDFRNDPEATDSAAERRFITVLGENTEEFVIGNWGWDWSQIVSARSLQPDTDYLIRFAVTCGMCSTHDEVTRFIIAPADCWDDRYVYDLAQSRYQPAVSKNLDGDLLRIFEIPFRTDQRTEYRLLFVAQHCELRVLPPMQPAAYSALPDCTYAEFISPDKQAQPAAPSPEHPADQDNAQPAKPADSRTDAEQRLIDGILRYVDECGSITADIVCEAFGIDRDAARKVLSAMLMLDMLSFDSMKHRFIPPRPKVKLPENTSLVLDILEQRLRETGGMTVEESAVFLQTDSKRAGRFLNMLLTEKRAVYNNLTGKYRPAGAP